MFTTHIIILKILKISFSIISAIFFSFAAYGKYPEPPRLGEVIKAQPFIDLFNGIKASAKYNTYGCIFLALSLLMEIILF